MPRIDLTTPQTRRSSSIALPEPILSPIPVPAAPSRPLDDSPNISQFIQYIELELGLSANTVTAYRADLHSFTAFCNDHLAISLPAATAKWHKKLQSLAAAPVTTPLSREQAEHIALVAFHLFRGPDDAGLYLRPADLHSPPDLLTAAESLLARRNPAKPLPDQASDRQQEAEPVQPEPLSENRSETRPSGSV
jgi:hypothetical protein